jgi:recombination protein RecA
MKPKKAAKAPKTVGAPATDKASGLADIAETLRSLKTKFGEEAIMTLDESKKVDIDAMPTGSIGLDDALGIGGFPRGRIIEIFGPESSGKTTLSLARVAEAPKARWYLCLYRRRTRYGSRIRQEYRREAR